MTSTGEETVILQLKYLSDFLAGVRERPAEQTRRLDEHYRLRTRNLESSPATHVFADKHVIDSDHVVAGFLIPHSVLLVCAAWRTGLSRAL